MNKRILVISPRYWPEDTKISDICTGFSKRGYSVDVICGQPNFPSGRFFKGYHTIGHKEERHAGVRILRHPEIRRGNGSGFRIMLNYLSAQLGAKIKAASLSKRRYDAVLNYQTSPVMSTAAGFKAAKRRGIKVVTYVIDLWPHTLYREMDMQSPLLVRLFRHISRRRYLQSDLIAVQNNQTKDYFTGEINIHPSKVSVIAQGPDRYLRGKKRDVSVMERYYGSFNIVTYDPLLERQDYKTVLDAAVMIRNAGIIDLKLIIVCTDRGNDLKKTVYKMNLNDIVFIEEESDYTQTARFYRIADAFLSCEKTSAGDEFSMPYDIVNYLSCARPVIFAGDGDGKRIIREAGCGLSSDPENAGELFKNIMELYRSGKEKLSEMGSRALKYQKENFSFEGCVDGLLSLLFQSSDQADEEFIINSNTTIIRGD